MARLVKLHFSELDFAYKPCFSSRPYRGNCPSPSSFRNQASRRNDIPDHMTRAKPQNPHAKVAKTHFTTLAFQATIKGLISIDSPAIRSNWTSCKWRRTWHLFLVLFLLFLLFYMRYTCCYSTCFYCFCLFICAIHLHFVI